MQRPFIFAGLSVAALSTLVACGEGLANDARATGGHGGYGGYATGLPAGWLYTNGAEIEVSDGKGGGKRWMGRGVNVDDIFLCGYNDTLWMSDAGQTLETMVS